MGSTPDHTATIRAALEHYRRAANYQRYLANRDFETPLSADLMADIDAATRWLDTLAAVQKPLICATCNDYLEAGARCEMCYGSAVSAYEETGEELDALKAQAQPAAPDALPDGIMPNWDHAPNWARYWTRDENGRGMWWEFEPYFSKTHGIWMDESEGKRTYATNKPTLRERVPTGVEA